MKKSFTLVELIIVVIIVMILASFAIPQFIQSVERAKGGKAKRALGLIAQAEKIYRIDNEHYIDAQSPNLESALSNDIDLDAIDKDASLDWQYVVEATPNTFIVTATRLDGSFKDQTITLNQSGVWTNERYP